MLLEGLGCVSFALIVTQHSHGEAVDVKDFCGEVGAKELWSV